MKKRENSRFSPNQKDLVGKSRILDSDKSESGQNGQMILFAVIILGSMISIALALGAIFIPKVRLLADVKSSVGALFAAESGIEWCLYNSRIQPSPTPAPPAMSNGATFQITPADCSGNTFRAVGNFKGVVRAFEASF